MSYTLDVVAEDTEQHQSAQFQQTAIANMSELMAELKRCDEDTRMIFIKAGAVWCGPCTKIKPFYEALMQHWSTRVPLATITFNIDDAEQVSKYFNVSRIPHFICLLPNPHPTLTLKELRFEGGDPTRLEQWVTNIMQKWIVGIQPSFPFANPQTAR
jgi:thioredoxin-like negative regulator of GroEL